VEKLFLGVVLQRELEIVDQQYLRAAILGANASIVLARIDATRSLV